MVDDARAPASATPARILERAVGPVVGGRERLALAVTNELSETMKSRATIGAPVLPLPVRAVIAFPVVALPARCPRGFPSFGVIALLYLLTEALLAEAHEAPDRPWVAAMCFIGFLRLQFLGHDLARHRLRCAKDRLQGARRRHDLRRRDGCSPG